VWDRRWIIVAGLPEGRACMRVPWCFVVHFVGPEEPASRPR
jgi:hypothetical protein